MKILALIMAVLVLALNCMPCMDEPYAENNNKANTEISKSCDQQEHNGTDNCSPFCSCNCCPGFTFAFVSLKAGYPALPSSPKSATYFSAKIPDVSIPVWQPPQLAA